uniref:Uncharacterized protein n=1 Tax=Pseudo-nitzschia australis TaxID=44445 RepID=A0A7S4ACC0_9STRA
MLAAEFFEKTYNSEHSARSTQQTRDRNRKLSFDEGIGSGDSSPISSSLSIAAKSRIEYAANLNCAHDSIHTAFNTEETMRERLAGFFIPVADVYLHDQRDNEKKLRSNAINDLPMDPGVLVDPTGEESSSGGLKSFPIQGMNFHNFSPSQIQSQIHSPKGVDETDIERPNVPIYDRKNQEDWYTQTSFEQDARLAGAQRDIEKIENFCGSLAKDIGYAHKDRSNQEQSETAITKRQTIRGTTDRKDRYEKASRENEYLKETIKKLEVEVSALIFSLANVNHGTNIGGTGGTDKKESFDDKTLSTDFTFIQPRATSMQHVDEKCGGTFNSSKIHSYRHDGKRRMKSEAVADETQLEESEQKIQQLLSALEISKQNEVKAKKKLKSLQDSLQETQSIRYSESMKITLKPASGMCSKVERLEQNRSRKEENLFGNFIVTKKKFVEAKTECAKLKQELAQIRSLVKSQQEGLDEGTNCRGRQGRLVNNKNDEGIKKVERARIDEHCDGKIIHYEIENKGRSSIKLNPKSVSGGVCKSQKNVYDETVSPKLKRNIENIGLNERESSALLESLDPPVVTQRLSRDDTSLLLEVHAANKSNIINMTSFVRRGVANGKLLEGNTPVIQTHDKAHYRSTLPDLGTRRLEENERSNVFDNKCTDQCLEESDTVDHSMIATKAISPSVKETTISSAPLKKTSLNDLIIKLKVSKKRLQRADQQLNALVNKADLLNTIRKSEASRLDGSINAVDSLDGSVEVSHFPLLMVDGTTGHN